MPIIWNSQFFSPKAERKKEMFKKSDYETATLQIKDKLFPVLFFYYCIFVDWEWHKLAGKL